MMTTYRIAFVLVILLAAMLPVSSAGAQTFWFAPQDPIVVQQAKQTDPADYMDLFKPEAPWKEGATELSVFAVSTQFVLYASDDMLRTVFNGVKERHVKTAVEIGTVVRLDTCGLGEGYAPIGMSEQVGKRLHNLNLELDYMAADEPVWFAHEVTWGTAKGGRPNCMYPVKLVAERVAMSVNGMRKYFPKIEVGDVEVVASDRTPPKQLIADYVEFARLLEAQIGQKLAFFHADIAWHSNPLFMIAPLRAAMKAQGIPFGVIIGGGLEHKTDPEWVQAGLSRLATLARNPATRPDEVVVQSWQRLPTHVLPETTRGTESFLLLHAEYMMAQTGH